MIYVTADTVYKLIDAPPNNLATVIITSVLDNINISCPKAYKSNPAVISFLSPILLVSFPTRGENINCPVAIAAKATPNI